MIRGYEFSKICRKASKYRDLSPWDANESLSVTYEGLRRPRIVWCWGLSWQKLLPPFWESPQLFFWGWAFSSHTAEHLPSEGTSQANQCCQASRLGRQQFSIWVLGSKRLLHGPGRQIKSMPFDSLWSQNQNIPCQKPLNFSPLTTSSDP
jgi:hypothetical protein